MAHCCSSLRWDELRREVTGQMIQSQSYRAAGTAKGERKAVEDEQGVRGWERRRALSGLGGEGRDSTEAGWQEMQTCRGRQTDRGYVTEQTQTLRNC